MSDKITLKEIADIAGISRNTVSKIVNGHYKGDKETQDRVIKLLQENNYKGMGSLKDTHDKTKTILLLAGGMLQKSFFACLLNELQQNELSKDYRLIYLGIQDFEVKDVQIPNIVKGRQVDGIICVEIFDKEFIEALLEYNIPTVFLNFASDMWSMQGNYDVVLMNNEYQTYTLTNTLIDKGCHNIAFVGNQMCSRCFYERYQGYRSALVEHNIRLYKELCIIIDSEENEPENIWSCIENMNITPDAFVVANDGLAIKLMIALKEHGINIPDEVSIVGYGNIPESFDIMPSLTTVDCNHEALSKTVLSCLHQRINNPHRPKNVVYVESEIIYRDSAVIQ